MCVRERVCLCMRVCVCVCVREGEKEYVCVCVREKECVFVRACVYVILFLPSRLFLGSLRRRRQRSNSKRRDGNKSSFLIGLL